VPPASVPSDMCVSPACVPACVLACVFVVIAEVVASSVAAADREVVEASAQFLVCL
jgi:Mg2+/Co2+ transporter CorB